MYKNYMTAPVSNLKAVILLHTAFEKMFCIKRKIYIQQVYDILFTHILQFVSVIVRGYLPRICLNNQSCHSLEYHLKASFVTPL